MPTAAYTSAAAKFDKQVQWLVEIDLDRCDLNYTSAPCTASDQGDGDRCYYSFGTCQDPTNFTKTTRTYRFCLSEVPWPDTTVSVWPLLKKFVAIPQEVKPSTLEVYPDKITLEFARDWLPPVPDSDKTGGAGLFNTTAVGEFWSNLWARNRNYAGRAVRVYRGFNTSGFLVSDFEQVGPDYKLKQVHVEKDICVVTGESELADLDTQKIPFAISDDNTIQDVGGINDSVTTVTVLDGTEFPDPADYTRNTIYVEMESEICSVTSISGNDLTIVRGQFGTTAAIHAQGVKVNHIVCFGTATAGPVLVMEVAQDLLEWGNIAAASVDDTTFDDITEIVWPKEDVLRKIRKPKRLSKLFQEIRETRSFIVYIDSARKFAAKVFGSNTANDAVLDDDSFLIDTVSVDEDEDQRITRVSIYYDTTEDSPDDPSDFSRALRVIDAELESANNYGDVKDDVFTDAWLDPSVAVSTLANIARRIMVRKGNGVRTFTFELESKDGTLTVGDAPTVQTRHLLDARGNQEVRPTLVTSRKEVGLSRIRYVAVDTQYNGRYFRIGPDTMTDTYDSATDDDKQYGYWGDTDNRVGSVKDFGYIFF